MDIGQIHRIIEKICPISGLSQISAEEYSIHFSENATADQRQAAQDILANIPFLSAKDEKIRQVDTDFDTAVKTGWDSGRGFHLGITSEDVSLLVGLFVLAKEGAALGIDPPPVIDMNGEAHQFNMQELTVLMLEYGGARAELAKTDASRRKAIENATTIEELNNI